MAGAEKGDEYLFKVLVVGEVCSRLPSSSRPLFGSGGRGADSAGATRFPQRSGGVPVVWTPCWRSGRRRAASRVPRRRSLHSRASVVLYLTRVRARRQVAGGKTSLVRRYVYNNFSENYQTTIGKLLYTDTVRRRGAGLATPLAADTKTL